MALTPTFSPAPPARYQLRAHRCVSGLAAYRYRQPEQARRYRYHGEWVRRGARLGDHGGVRRITAFHRRSDSTLVVHDLLADNRVKY